MLPVEDVHSWTTSTAAELVIAQITAIDAWHRAWPSTAAPGSVASREQKRERERQVLVLDAVRSAMREQAARRACADPVPDPRTPRAVVVHRDAWFVDRLCAALEQYGIDMVARLHNGAEALGVTIAEQPDLLLMEDAMPLMRGEDVLEQAQQFAPRTLLAIQVDRDARARELTSRGADAAVARLRAPVDVAADIAGLVAAHGAFIDP